jgi:hypothetical protein
MSDPTRIAVAAARARDLLTEDHQPLLMTPGAVRALLARTQRRLQEMADAVEPVLPAEDANHDAAALSDARRLLEHRPPADAGC